MKYVYNKRKELEEMMENRNRELLEKTKKHITATRLIVLEEFKDKGLITDYRRTNNQIITSDSSKKVRFGSCAGFDNMYLVIASEEYQDKETY